MLLEYGRLKAGTLDLADTTLGPAIESRCKWKRDGWDGTPDRLEFCLCLSWLILHRNRLLKASKAQDMHVMNGTLSLPREKSVISQPGDFNCLSGLVTPMTAMVACEFVSLSTAQEQPLEHLRFPAYLESFALGASASLPARYFCQYRLGWAPLMPARDRSDVVALRESGSAALLRGSKACL